MSGNKKSNRLINEKSPYLLEHAYNPVDWLPWTPEAFQKASSAYYRLATGAMSWRGNHLKMKKLLIF